MHPDGKIRCGPFTESQIPIELLLEYHRRHQSKNDKTPNAQDVDNYHAKLNEIRSFRDYYPKQIERLRDICYHELLYIKVFINSGFNDLILFLQDLRFL